jgi:hypothetical protein
MSNSVAALVCATGVWLIAILVTTVYPVKRPAGEAWVVTSSDKMLPRSSALTFGLTQPVWARQA